MTNPIFYDIIPPKVLEEKRHDRGVVKTQSFDKPKPNFAIVKSFIFKIIAVLIIICLNWTGLSAIIETFAYYNDTEDSPQNVFSASTLDFSIPLAPDFSPPVIPTATSSKNINIVNDGILGFQYEVQTANTTGTLCNYLDLNANLDGSLVYSGSLTSFYYNAGEFSTSTDDWQFTATLTSNDPTLQNQTCNFDFVFDGIQIGDAGFYDQEIISNTITSGQWIVEAGDVVINELMWMGSRWNLLDPPRLNPDDEWIELRNMTELPINLSNWQLTKLTDSGEELMLEIPSGNVIPANGFFLISNFGKDNSRINVEPDLVNATVDLRDWNLQVKLYKGDWQDSGNLIDIADDGDGEPLKGLLGPILQLLHFSMERNNIPGEGTSETNWHTCWDNSPEMKAYWDPLFIHNESINRGTPGAQNLSDQDEAALIEYYQQLEAEWSAEGLFIPDPISEEENYDEEEVPEISIEEKPPAEEEPVVEEEPIIEEEPAEEIPVIEDVLIIDGAPVDGVPADGVPVDGVPVDGVPVDGVPAIKDQPAVAPDGSGESVSDGGSGDGDGDTGSSLDGSGPAEGAGESSGDSGVDANGESVNE